MNKLAKLMGIHLDFFILYLGKEPMRKTTKIVDKVCTDKVLKQRPSNHDDMFYDYGGSLA
ncbi:hypothetical protein TW73_18835 [Pseudoalteromonas piscicida]|nr:hypothetical protein TW73_18835 [Pseudoalteromonas piscicida]